MSELVIDAKRFSRSCVYRRWDLSWHDGLPHAKHFELMVAWLAWGCSSNAGGSPGFELRVEDIAGGGSTKTFGAVT